MVQRRQRLAAALGNFAGSCDVATLQEAKPCSRWDASFAAACEAHPITTRFSWFLWYSVSFRPFDHDHLYMLQCAGATKLTKTGSTRHTTKRLYTSILKVWPWKVSDKEREHGLNYKISFTLSSTVLCLVSVVLNPHYCAFLLNSAMERTLDFDILQTWRPTGVWMWA